MTEHRPKVAAIVLNWNRRDEALKTVGILLQDSYPHLEVIVVDNASSDGTVAALRASYPEVKVLALPYNMGTSGRDVGVLNTDAEYTAFFDDDSNPDAHAIARMVEIFEANPKVGIVPFNIYGGAFTTEYWEGAAPGDLIGYTACGVGLRRQAIIEAGFYDPDFVVYAEEYDLALRMLNRGWQIAFEPTIRAHHRASALHRSYKRTRTLTTRNETWMAIKYFPLARIPLIVCRVLFNNASLARLDGFPPWYTLLGTAMALWNWRAAWKKREPIKPDILARYERNFWGFQPIGPTLRGFVTRRLPTLRKGMGS